uniref:Uncharacterized protein n=1 Tax=Rhizophora mucronata TaxID=61149 RepID=A0A2P2PK61_RHIMU
MLGIVAKRTLASLFGFEPMRPSHSSVTTKVTRISGFLEDRTVQRLIMGFTWPLPGKGSATTWQIRVGRTWKSSIPGTLSSVVWRRYEGIGIRLKFQHVM